MITKFIYELDVKNRKRLVALVEDKNPGFVTEEFFPLEERASFIRKDDEIATYTNGDYYYICFIDNNELKYLDIDILREGVKIRVTDNLVHAACYSLDFMYAILNCFDNFGYASIIEIPSYISLNRKNELNDTFEKIFAKIKDDSYCQINEDDEIKFVARDIDKQYYLTDNFSKAYKMNKKDIRQILVVNGFLDRKTQKSDVYFSPFNCFYDGVSGYAFAGNLDVSYVDEVLTIKENTSLSGTLHLVNNEEKFKLLLNLYRMTKQEPTEDCYYLSFNGKYVFEKENQYYLIDNPSQATLFSGNKIEYLIFAYSLFMDNPKFQKFNTDLMYLYNEDDVYSFSNEGKEGVGKIVYSQYYDKIKRLVIDKFVKGNSIIIVDDKYLHLDVLSDNSFKLTWLETGFNATNFSLDAANTLIDIFKWKAKRKDIISNLDMERLNISNDKENTSYKDILNTIVKNKDRMCSYDDTFEIKVESEKGALEYIRRFYLKTISDMEELFKKLLADNSINKILVVGSGCNLDLLALNNVVNKPITYSTVDMNKWGYFPHINLNPLIDYKMAYRCSFLDLSKEVIKEYDLVVFSKTFNENNISNMLEEIKSSNLNIVLANVMTANLYKINDEFFKYFSSIIKVNRKLFDSIIEENDESISTFEYMRKNVCKCRKDKCSCINHITDRKNSYYSVININDEIKNYF